MGDLLCPFERSCAFLYTYVKPWPMAINAGIFGDATSFEHRYIPEHDRLKEHVELWKRLGLRIVLTSGTFDLFHIGHAQYLEKAKALGDVLIIGVDSDDRVRKRKGPDRPVVPQDERISIISHVRHADVITLKNVDDPSNHLIELVSPDILVVSRSTNHQKRSVDKKTRYCKEVIELEPQSVTSTSAKLRLMHTTGASKFAENLLPEMQKLIEDKLREHGR